MAISVRILLWLSPGWLLEYVNLGHYATLSERALCLCAGKSAHLTAFSLACCNSGYYL